MVALVAGTLLAGGNAAAEVTVPEPPAVDPASVLSQAYQRQLALIEREQNTDKARLLEQVLQQEQQEIRGDVQIDPDISL